MHVRHSLLLVKSGFGKFGIITLGLFLIFSLIAPVVTKDPASRTTSTLQPPSFEHLLGTNDVGQDILSRLIWGARTSILVAIGVASISTLLSILAGASAALIGGIYEKVVMRIVDLFLVFPSLIVLILIAAFVKPNIWMLIILIAVLRWQGGARIIRAQILSLKEQMHVSAALFLWS